MENKGNTQLKEIKKYLALLSDANDYTFDILSDEESQIQLHFNGSNSKLSEKNYHYFLKRINAKNNAQKTRLSNNRNLNLKIRKSYLSVQNKILKDLKKIVKNGVDSTNAKLYLDDLERREIFHSIHSISTLPSIILKLQSLQHFQSCQVIIHEKGNTSAKSYCNTGSEKRISADQFNKIFQTIKKSKGHFFTQSQFPKDCIELIGSIISFTSETLGFNWIIFFGRNDLLNPTIEESKHCNKSFEDIAPIIDTLLNKNQYDDKVSNIIKLFESIHYPISIIDIHDRIIFTNSSYDLASENKLAKMLTYKSTFKSYTMTLYYLNNNHEGPTDLYHHHKVTLLGELLNTLGHELSNPLFGLNLSADLLKETSDQCDVDFLEQISLSSSRCQQIIKNFSQLYEKTDTNKDINLIELISETVTLTKSETRGIKKSIHFEGTKEDYAISANPTYLSQIIFNLVINSAQALSQTVLKNDSLIEINCYKKEGFYSIYISDNGPGIPEELKDSITDTYFTTKKSGNGLGLAICINLLTKMRGSLSFDNKKESSGAIFTINLPIP